jgi:UDP-GlcNAc:undecaprenyl-phosphate GlcNAc-1-phosphate transferase
MEPKHLWALLLAVLAAAVALVALMRFAPALGWLDHPDERKAHAEPIPPVGGLAWFVGFALGCFALGFDGPPVSALLVALGALVMLGIVDDRQPLPSGLRFLMQVLLVLLLAAFGGLKLYDLGQLLWPDWTLALGWAAIPFTVFACVGVINALNMADGMDGLAGWLAVVTLSVVAAFAHYGGQPVLGMISLLAIAALLPFLWLNTRWPWRRRASVFLGDAGSMSLGLLLAWSLVQGAQGPERLFAPATALWLCAVPLIDTVSVMLRRIAARRSPFAPDQQHLHHLFLRAGFSVRQTLLGVLAIALALAGLGAGLAALGAPESLQALAFLGLGVGYHLVLVHAVKRQRWLGRALSAVLVRA